MKGLSKCRYDETFAGEDALDHSAILLTHMKRHFGLENQFLVFF